MLYDANARVPRLAYPPHLGAELPARNLLAAAAMGRGVLVRVEEGVLEEGDVG